ncbi:MAG: branched-chain amino acid transport system substrate-binding protein [Nocardioidaceae bacterium]|nr:branched-chain amino acid transport system substrate-binding protein [Nocardioidaceae bacterium]
MKSRTRSAKLLALLLGLALVSAACGNDKKTDSSSQGTTATTAKEAGPPIKLGSAIDLSGGVAATGKDALAGMQYAVDELNAGKGVIGRKIDFITRDNQSKPEVAVEEARKLVEGDKVVALMAPASSAASLAVSTSVSKTLKIPMFTHSSNTDALTVKSFHPYIFSLGPNALMESNAQAKALSAEKYTKYGLLAADYEGGHANIETFKEYIKKYNPNVTFTVELFPPLGEKDYTSYINKIISAKPDFVFSVLFGGDLIAFSKQAKAVGFFEKVPFTALYDSTTLKALGADAPEGTRGYGRAPFFAVKTPQAQKFTTDFHAKTGGYPSDWTIMGYDVVMAWAQGVEKAGTTDADPVVAALETTKIKTLRGDVNLRKVDHQADVPEYYGVITKPDPVFGFPIWSNPKEIPGADILLPEADVLKRRG